MDSKSKVITTTLQDPKRLHPMQELKMQSSIRSRTRYPIAPMGHSLDLLCYAPPRVTLWLPIVSLFDLCSHHFHMQIPTLICIINLHYNCKTSHHMFYSDFHLKPGTLVSQFPTRGNEPRPRPWNGHILTVRLCGNVDMLTNRHFRSWAPLLAQNCETLTSVI